MFYAGIGSRETPPPVLRLMSSMASWLQRQGWTLRSGAAPGADTAFERGAGDAKQIFLPWPGFNGSSAPCVYDAAIAERAEKIAAQHHPAWVRCSAAARKLHARNVHQILVPDLLQPSAFVVCWTSDGKASGGTGQALRIAAAEGVPVFNLYFDDTALRVRNFAIREGVFA